jgi:O-antigen/teichoic acid export membrane protein
LQANFKRFIFGPLSRFGISHKLQATALWSMLESFSSPLFSLLLIPIFTHNLGMENYGLYVMVMAFVSFFGFTGLGMSTSITYYLAVNSESINPKYTAERLGSALGLTFFGTVVFSCFFILAHNLYGSQIESYYPLLIAQQQLIYASLILIVITQLDMVVSASLKGLQQFKISSKVEFVLRLLSFIIITLVTFTQKNVIAIVLITLIMTLFSLIVRFRTLNKIVDFHFSDIKINKPIATELFHFGKWMTLQSLAGASFGSIDKLVIGTVLGNKVLGIYNVLLSIAQLIHYIPANMLTFIMPKVAKNNENLSISLLKKIFILTTIISSFFAVLIIILKKFIFLNFHVDSSYEILFYGLIFAYILLSLNIPSYFIALGMNLIKAVSLQCIIGSIVGVSSLLILISKYGILGAVASKLIYSVVAIFLVIPVLRKMKLS